MFRTINKRSHYPEMKLNNIAIERVSKFKFLGIWLDEYLNLNHHISHISIKLSRINGTMSRPGLGSSTVDQVLKYTKYPKYIPSTSTGQVLIF